MTFASSRGSQGRIEAIPAHEAHALATRSRCSGVRGGNPSVITRGQLAAHHHEHATQFKQLDQVHFPSEQFKVIGHPPVIMLIAKSAHGAPS
jgi:hypothetical protein